MCRVSLLRAALACCLLAVRPAASILNPVHDKIDGAQHTVSYLAQVAADPIKYKDIAACGLQDFITAPDKSQLPQRAYSWQELARADGVDGRRLLLVINGKVYDFTDFAVYHPAGPEVLKKYVGRDATVVFRTCHIPRWLEDISLQIFRVGWVEEYQEGQYETPRPDNIPGGDAPLLLA